MCFSAQADVAAGLVVGAIGVDALRQVHHRRELALGALPALFGFHLLTEAFVWWDLQGDVPSTVGHAAVWVYLFIAFVVLPVLVPVALIAIEPVGTRRALMVPLLAVGAVVSAVLLAVIVTGHVGAIAHPHYIEYESDLTNGGRVVVWYLVATCGVQLLASDRRIVAFGMANLVVVAALTWLQSSGLISLWCGWAAITSVAIAAYLRQRHGQPLPTVSRRPVGSHG